MSSFKCFVIGGNTLMMECCEILQKRGHQLGGVISADPRVATWASQHEIPHFLPKDEDAWIGAMQEAGVEYLFSIAYLAVVPERALLIPTLGAVNFHDGPLPHYAGLNTPAWALMAGEKEYGITWHTMTAKVDQGDVLLTKRFEVSPEETSLTINTKCFEVALETFGEMLNGLAAGTLRGEPQSLGGFKYFGRHDRPAGACFLDLNQPALKLANLVRALNFGPYDNPLGVPKLVFGKRVMGIAMASERDGFGAPGSITAVEGDAIVIGCGEGQLAVTEVVGLEGQKQALADFIREANIQIGDRVELLSLDDERRYTQVNETLARSEGFWKRRLEKVEDLDLPFAGKGDGMGHSSFSVRLPDGVTNDGLLAYYSAFLGRAMGRSAFYLGYSSTNLRDDISGCSHFIMDRVPMRVALDVSAPFSTYETRLKKELSRLGKHKTYLRDLIGREPSLSSRADYREGRALSALYYEGAGFEADAAHALALVFENGQAVLHGRRDVYSDVTLQALADCFANFMAALTEDRGSLATVSLLSGNDRDLMLKQWNATEVDYDQQIRIHEQFEAAVAATPDAPALVHRDVVLTYAELNTKANQLAHKLRDMGVGPDDMVGIHLKRCHDLVIGLLAAQKAGGAYVPLDPAYPEDRIDYMIEDAGLKVILTHSNSASSLPTAAKGVLVLDTIQDELAALDGGNLSASGTSSSLAYVIYTSGSTGKPKGVMVPHRTAVNFFKGMDERIPHDTPGTWLAVTSLSFDISVLELLWTLGKGFKVVLYEDTTASSGSGDNKGMDFGLFYFSNSESAEQTDKYRLLIEGAKYADTHEFSSVWTPERHFHDFGGLYSHPAVTGAAVAAVTKNVAIRAGSVVVPLHHPARIAEAWSIVDNLSNGRVGIAAAAGWAPTDFLLQPQNYHNPKKVMFDHIETVQKLWAGEAVAFEGATGKEVEIKTLPRPVQKSLPIWITTAGNIETYKMAGKIGANLLTHLLGQSTEDIAPKIKAYRDARREAGFDPDAGIVTLMLHTFVGYDEEFVRNTVRGPLKNYLASSLDLLRKYAWAFPAFSRPKDVSNDVGDDFDSLTEEERDAVLEGAFARYYETSGLFGHPDTCLKMVDRVKAIGVNEIGCLIDFGMSTDLALEHLEALNEVRRRANIGVSKASSAEPAVNLEDFTLPKLIERHGVTHMQCTPSMAQMLTTNLEMEQALGKVKHLYIGGEAFPGELARKLTATGASVMNMYGPTETTIWSTTQDVDSSMATVDIGKPLANQQVYVLDRWLNPVPKGGAGELYIAGDGVTRGYLRRPSLTATRFVPDPFGGDGKTMYRTGDLVRWSDVGVLEFLGRVDFQVKIRGFRIELGEIETRLSKHPAVREAVVLAREDQPGDVRLVGYLVAEGDAPDTEDLKAFMGEKLPDYMVPSNFAVLESFPLTPNKKIDRKALPAPDAAKAKSKVVYAPPGNETETKIVSLWQELLGRDQVGIDDNFFDIGGHSLLVVRMHRQLEEALGRSVLLTDLYRFTTIRGLADYLNTGGNTSEKLKKSTERAQRRLAARRRR